MAFGFGKRVKILKVFKCRKCPASRAFMEVLCFVCTWMKKTWRATSLVCTACMNAINKVCHESMNPSSATLANRMCFGNCHTNITRVSTRIFGKAFRNTPFAGNGLFRSFLRGTSGLLIKIHGQDYQPISQWNIFEAGRNGHLSNVSLASPSAQLQLGL